MPPMLIDGRTIAKEIYTEIANQVSHMDVAPHLTIFTCAPDFATQKYLTLKKKKAAEVGIQVNVIEFPEAITTDEMVTTVMHAQMQTDGIIVQLPLPDHIDTQTVLNAVPASYDVDGMHYDGTSTTILSPVVGAIKEMCERHDVLLATLQVVIVGHGRLVGKPAELWLQKQGAHVIVITKETSETEAAAIIAHADVLVLGVGQADLVTPNMIKRGVIIFDAGTSEAGGELRGDASADCVQKASLITPVPGGIGPVTVAVLLRNLIELRNRQ